MESGFLGSKRSGVKTEHSFLAFALNRMPNEAHLRDFLALDSRSLERKSIEIGAVGPRDEQERDETSALMQADQNLEMNSMMPETKHKSEFIPPREESDEGRGRNAEVKVGRSGERNQILRLEFLTGSRGKLELRYSTNDGQRT